MFAIRRPVIIGSPHPIFRNALAAAALGAVFAGLGCPGGAARAASAPECGGKEVCPGIFLTAENFDALKGATLEGHTIGDLLTDKVAWQVREHGLKLRLVHATPFPKDPKLEAATARNRDSVTLDPETGMVKGWVAGNPFPDIREDDPQAGLKLVWNLTYGRMKGDAHEHPGIHFLLIDGPTGLERNQTWNLRRIYMKGRLRGAPVLGDGEIFAKTLLYAVLPQDIKGLGSFSIRYDTGKLDDSWAYVREVRRVRRLSGGAWMTPIGSTDELNDDFNTFNAYPTWYQDFKLVGKRYLLAPPQSSDNWVVPGGATPAETYPLVELNQSPHWNIVDKWEVRPIYVIDATPPDEHPYSKRMMYLDAENYSPYMADAYDRSGDFLRWMVRGYRFWPLEDDPQSVAHWPVWGNSVDFKRVHATAFMADPNWKFNTVMSPEDVSLAVLESEGR